MAIIGYFIVRAVILEEAIERRIRRVEIVIRGVEHFITRGFNFIKQDDPDSGSY